MTRLGAPFKILATTTSHRFGAKFAKRIAELNSAGVPRDWPVPRSERARVQTEVAIEFSPPTTAGRDRQTLTSTDNRGSPAMT